VDGTILWSFQTGGGIESSPAIGEDGTIYVGAHDGYLYAVTKEGSEKWKTRVGTPKIKPGYGHNTSILSSPAIADDGTIYIASRDQYLFAISSEGTEKWRFPVEGCFDTWAAPIIGKDGTVYFPSSMPNPGLYAINPDGTEKWRFSAGTNMFNSPAIGKDGTIYAGLPESTRANKMYAINPDGTKNGM
jgi:outer membrane protein assembly factor BamB